MQIKELGSDIWIIDNTCYCPTCLMSKELEHNTNKNIYIKWIYFWLVKLERLELVLNKCFITGVENLNKYSIEELDTLLNEIWEIVVHKETDLECKFKFNE